MNVVAMKAAAKSNASSSWDKVKSAAQHPNTITAAKYTGIVVGVGIAYGVAAAVATKVYTTLS